MMYTNDEFWKRKFSLTLFDDPAPADPDPEPAADDAEETSGIITAADIAPEISIDIAQRFTGVLRKFFSVIGLAKRTPRGHESTIKIYKWSGELAQSPAEGELIPRTNLRRELVATYDLTLKKYRASVSAEAVQGRGGRARVINEKDDALVSRVVKKMKDGFFDVLNLATGTATAGATLQATLANCWAAVSAYFEDEDVSPIFFVNPEDVATYLGQAGITTQTAFGFRYVEGFLGLGTAVISKRITKGTVIATASENLRFDYIPARGGDLSEVFGLTSDADGYIGLRHTVSADDATISTLVMSGGLLYAEDASGLFKGTISGM